MIVDTIRDLNIYKEGFLNEDLQEKGASGCCGTTAKARNDALISQARLKDVDLNEWIGESWTFLGGCFKLG